MIHTVFTSARMTVSPVVLILSSLSLILGSSPVGAQPRYSEVQVEALATGEEISGQPGLWVMEVYFKPLRMIAVDVTNPKTGKTESKFVWYLVYRAINRPLESPAVGNTPVNELDPPVLPPKFIPEFTLVTTDGEPQVYQDQIIPEALKEIERRERRAYQSSVSVVATIPDPVPATAENPEELYGVATFVGIDPEADRYTLFLTGFSNGMRTVTAPDGSQVVQHKTIEMKYWRPGDRFELREPEIRIDGAPRWIYR